MAVRAIGQERELKVDERTVYLPICSIVEEKEESVVVVHCLLSVGQQEPDSLTRF